MARLFEDKDHAKLYSSYRPCYPSELYEHIMTYLAAKCPTRCLALDVGCGSGQGTLPLANYFDHVIGLDVSEAQIAEASSRENTKLAFRVGTGEDLGFVKSGSVDLITVAATLHWLDIEKFYQEARRVLCFNGVLAVYSYRLLHVHTDNTESEELLANELYEVTFKQGGYIHPRVLLVHSFFEDSFILPFRDYERVNDIVIRHTWTIEQIKGFLGTYSAYQQYLKDHPDSTLLNDTAQRLKKIYKDKDNKILIPLSWPMVLLLGRN